jgi:hypothetical protein
MSEPLLEVRYLVLGRRGGRGYQPMDLEEGDPCHPKKDVDILR